MPPLTGLVFDIERFATKDGPGIRTVVFLKGCNLGCGWCQNPESQSPAQEIIYHLNQCGGCGRCLEGCSAQAIAKDRGFGLVTDKEKCVLCGKCVEGCFYEARRMVGRPYTVSELMTEIQKDLAFFQSSQGGVTFSGGEPLLQARFLTSVARECRDQGIHLALETCGAVPWKTLSAASRVMDLVYMDFKHIDPETHRLWTGRGNDLILENLKLLSRSFQPLIVRIPIIPGFNQDLETVEAMFDFLKNQVAPVEAVELLPFHRLGRSKYQGLARTYELGETESLTNDDLRPYEKAGLEMGLPVRIGTL